MISYAQNREDVLLDRAFPRGLKGFYIDIGAYDPTLNSVTRHFYDLGWHGVNVEPAEEPFERLDRARRRDVNLNVGVADEEGTLTLYKSPPAAGWSTFSAEIAGQHRKMGIDLEETKVPVTTLTRICEEHVGEGRTIDFMSIDVEGFEEQVIRGADFSRWRPRVIVVEATEPGRTVPTHQQWEQLLLDAGYAFAAFDGLNRYYVRNEDSGLLEVFSTPANILDDYVSYQHLTDTEDLRTQVSRLERQLAAARAVTDSIKAELGTLPGELQQLHSQYHWMERAVAGIKTEFEDRLAIAAGQAQAEHDQIRALLDATTAELHDVRGMMSGVGPTSLAVARRIAGLAGRFPALAAVAKRLLRLALKVKRAVS